MYILDNNLIDTEFSSISLFYLGNLLTMNLTLNCNTLWPFYITAVASAILNVVRNSQLSAAIRDTIPTVSMVAAEGQGWSV